ncbi:cytoplasmic protein [Spirulina major CS-329]|uniref:cytoplasmic protein n=1 Tax=Spirulina TaxID=1154 RepID=UPI00232CF32C|nr:MULTISPECIES: cytoplasmic protein [Spirulina]MDB9496457.1 cytoplasmic protein [Spirulina subsalsa CS-330]MDB9502671.1 cytoplasmic protein [Spirulina major CS-329]
MTEPPHITAHAHSIRHYDEIQRSDTCGCFYCCQIFPPSQIKEWVQDGDRPADQTALCPHCGIDSIISSASGYPITAAFLHRMHDYWF